MAEYQEQWVGPDDSTVVGITRLEDGACIPADPANPDYEAFLNWQTAGGVADPAFSQAEIDQLDLEARQNNRIKLLQQATIDQFKMILALFQVGKDKGVWTNTDFDADLRAKAADWLQLINDYESEA